MSYKIPTSAEAPKTSFVIILEAHGLTLHHKFRPQLKSPNVGTISWMACMHEDADGGAANRERICSGAYQRAEVVSVDTETEINDMLLQCNCFQEGPPHFAQIAAGNNLRCEGTPCDSPHCRIKGCDRMGIYVCAAQNLGGPASASASPEMALVHQQKHAAAMKNVLNPPFLFAGLDEISRAAAGLTHHGKIAPDFMLSDLMVWIQYNLPSIIRRYTRGSRRMWRGGDDNLIKEKLQQGKIKYALVINACRPRAHADTWLPESHRWDQGAIHPAGTSFTVETLNAALAARRAAVERILAEAAAAAAAAPGAVGVRDEQPVPSKTFLEKLGDGLKKFADGHDEVLKDGRLRGGHRKTNRLRRTRRRHKKTKRPRRRRKMRRRRRRR